MLTLLKDYKDELEVNGTVYPSVERAISALKSFSGEICIRLHESTENGNKREIDGKKCGNMDGHVSTEYKIRVKQYMTKPASPEFDFMAKFNNNNPMPLCVMVGTVEKETRGMVYMKLHGIGEREVHCMRCNRTLTNPISKKYGIGPECITKVPFLADMMLDDVEGIINKLQEVTWEGWVIKSAIIEQEEV